VLRSLAEWDAIAASESSSVPLSQALQRMQRLARPGSRVLLLTDGFSADSAAEGPLALLAAHCDVAAVILADPLERSAPPPGRYAVRADSANVILDFGAAHTRSQWPQLFAERRQHLIGMLKRHGLGWTELSTDAEPEPALERLLGLGRRHAARQA